MAMGFAASFRLTPLRPHSSLGDLRPKAFRLLDGKATVTEAILHL